MGGGGVVSGSRPEMMQILNCPLAVAVEKERGGRTRSSERDGRDFDDRFSLPQKKYPRLWSRCCVAYI